MLAWFERLGRLYPGHDFEVHDVAGRGRAVAFHAYLDTQLVARSCAAMAAAGIEEAAAPPIVD